MTTFKISRKITADVLVVGGGGAAARAALTAAENGANVRIAIKSKWLHSGSTATAFSELLAIAAAIGHGDERDKPEIHYEDTMEAGRCFIDPRLVWVLASEAPDRIQDLIDLGLNFDKQKNGKLVQGMSDFATYPRTCRVNGVTARHILNTLANELKKSNVPVDEHIMVFRLLTDENDRIIGALAHDGQNEEMVLYETGSVILACGGAHYLYRYGVGTPDMTGDGYAMAYEMGIPLVNMEFVQIGPAVIDPLVTLLSGPVWKTNPILVNDAGERFLEKNLPDHITVENVYAAKAFPFTVSNPSFYLDTSIQQEFEKHPAEKGYVWGDLTVCLEEILEGKIPKTKRVLKSKGIDITRERFKIGLVAQCMNGGAQILNPNGETSIPGLFIAGETAGGVRGPDRPGGNSLAEGQVFGYRTGKAAAGWSKGWKANAAEIEKQANIELEKLNSWITASEKGNLQIDDAVRDLKKKMHQNCLVIRSEERLADMWAFLKNMESNLREGNYLIEAKNIRKAVELRHMVITSKAITLAARERRESRSCHYREDYPNKDDANWKKSIRILCRDGEMAVERYTWPTDIREERNESFV
ncbi:FAD-binding protein [Aneurinibacillus terranovensis]|uniref:FAD-binding protein n=1 Tax=Aneurinibacillus terranovensis TaxID=278991 RepID=UPI0004164132|nr:FAD-binding protein [Aneurinibacillus terranovensis]